METIPFDIEKFKAGWKLVHEGWGIELYRFVLLPEGEAVYINWSKGGESVKYYIDNLHSSVYKFRLLSPSDDNSFEKWFKNNFPKEYVYYQLEYLSSQAGKKEK